MKLNRSGENEYHWLVSNLRWKASYISLLSMMLPIGFWCMPLSSWWSSFLILVRWEFLLAKDAGFCWMFLLHLLRWSYDFFSSLLIWCVTLIDFQMLNWPCIPRINPIWLWCIVSFIYCWIWLVKIFLEFLHYVHVAYWSIYSFLVMSLSDFGIRIIWVL